MRFMVIVKGGEDYEGGKRHTNQRSARRRPATPCAPRGLPGARSAEILAMHADAGLGSNLPCGYSDCRPSPHSL